jgi:hypothetical protein
MSTPDDGLFLLAVAVLVAGALWELSWTLQNLGPFLAAVLRGVCEVMASSPEPAGAPMCPLPALVPTPAPVPLPATNYLETMSPEELDRFLSETDE